MAQNSEETTKPLEELSWASWINKHWCKTKASNKTFNTDLTNKG